MLATKIACPHCQTILKPRKPVPHGKLVNCPQCKQPFRAGSASFQAGPPPVPMPHFTAQAPPPVTAPYVGMPPPIGFAPRPTSQGKRLFFVLGGLLFVALLGGALLWVFLGAGGSGGGTSTPGKEPDLVLPPTVKKDKVKPKAKPLIVLTEEEEKTVKEMTDKGVAWLRTKQREDGTFPPYNSSDLGPYVDGVTAMAGLTLLSCGVDPRDEAIVKAAKRIRAAGPKLNKTYELSLAVLFLDRLGDPADAPLLDTLTFRLICGQTDQGGWSYTCPLYGEKEHRIVYDALETLAKGSYSHLQGTPAPAQEMTREAVVKTLPDPLKKIGSFSKPPDPPGEFFRHGGDNSNTQFAVLALWAARKYGLPVDRPLELAVRRFKESQNPDGSWDYGFRNRVLKEPTMTCAGLLALAVEYGVRSKEDLKGSRPEDNPAIKRGLEVVGAALPADPKARSGFPPAYYLWSVERVAMLFQLEKIDGKDWYRWGMTILQDHQQKDGHWRQGWTASTDVADTCFALLFLHRINLAEDLTDKLTEFGLPGGAAAAPMGPARKE